MRAGIATVVVMLLGCASVAFGPSTPPTVSLLVLASVALFLELLAVPQRGFGFFSYAFACHLAITLTPSLGSRWALGVATIGLLLRTFAKGNPRLEVRWREALADLLPSLAALTTACLMIRSSYSILETAAVGLLMYLPLYLWIPEWLAEESPGVEVKLWRHLREMNGFHCLAIYVLGPITARLTSFAPFEGLWLIPVFLALQRSSRIDLLRLEEIEKEILKEKAERSQQVLQETAQRLHRTSQALQAQVQSRFLLEELTRRLAQCPSRPAVWEVLMSCLADTIPHHSLAFFCPDENQLLPVQWKSPHHAALESAALHRKTEPVVEQAWSLGQTVFQQGLPTRERLFPDEGVAVALPLPGQGVLYLGRSSDQAPIQDADLEILKIVTGQGVLALQSVHRLQESQEALHLYQGAHAQLSQWVEGLSLLLEGTRALGASLEAEALLDRFRQIIGSLLPEHRGILIFENRLHLAWPSDDSEWEGWQNFHQAVLRSGRPLLIEEFTRTRWSPPQPDLHSLLVMPLFDEDGYWGSVLLGSPVAGAFVRQHQDLLSLLCSHLVASLRRAELNRQIRESQGRLAQSSKMAAVGQLAAGVAHELNTPLAAAVLQLDSAMLRIDKRPELVKDKINIALQALEQARNIVAKLLNYSRESRAGKKQLDLNDIVHDTLLLIGGQIEIDGVTVGSQLLKPLPLVEGNQTEIQQVLTNLLLNARDAAVQSQQRRLEVETGVNGAEVYLQVTDYGPGIPEEIREHIFEPFFTTKPVGKGTGLGLSVCQEIVKNHGGQLRLSCQPGRTIFRLSLGGEP